MPSQVEPGRDGQSRTEPNHGEPRQADRSPVRAGAFWNFGVPYMSVFSLRLFRPFSKGLDTGINQIWPYVYARSVHGISVIVFLRGVGGGLLNGGTALPHRQILRALTAPAVATHPGQ